MKKKNYNKFQSYENTKNCFKFEIVAPVMENKLEAKYVANVSNKNNIFWIMHGEALEHIF